MHTFGYHTIPGNRGSRENLDRGVMEYQGTKEFQNSRPWKRKLQLFRIVSSGHLEVKLVLGNFQHKNVRRIEAPL